MSKVAPVHCSLCDVLITGPLDGGTVKLGFTWGTLCMSCAFGTPDSYCVLFKLHGETYATVVTDANWSRWLVVEREKWNRDEALLLADFITKHLAGPVSFIDKAV